MRKKPMAVVGFVVLFLLTVVPSAGAVPQTDCTDVQYNATDPYEVWNARQLQCMSSDGDYGLQSDINLSGTEFKPIPAWNRTFGNSTRDLEEFTGSLEGNGYDITGLSVYQPDEKYVGLFESVGEGASVTNLNLRDVNVTGRSHVGGLAGDVASGGEVSGVTVEGRVSGDSNVGGVVGMNTGEVTDVSAQVNVSGDNDVGRLVGDNRGTAEPANPLPVPGFTAVVAVVAFLVVVVRRCR
jgi:hypothetical protein